MAEPTIQLGGGNWAGKSDNLLGYYKEGDRFYKQDFTFSRSTSGTRVNSSGLIETAQVLGSEEVTNGDFTETPLGTGWTVVDSDADNYVVFNGSTARLKFLNTSPVTVFRTSDSILTSGKSYKLIVDIALVTSGAVKIDGDGITETFNTAGLNERIITPTANTNLSFYRASANVDITFNSVSVKEVFENNIPRVDYLNNSNGSLILEPQRSNLITYSEDFSQWTNQGSGTGSAPVVTSNNAISPDGTQNADKVVFNKGTGVTPADFSVLTTSFTSQSNTASVYIKADSPQRIVIRNSSTWVGYDIGTEWTRIEKTDTGGSLQIGLRDGYGIADVPNTATVYLWGAQVEAGSYATTLINTSGSSVTRNADTCELTNVADRIGQTEGSIFIELDVNSRVLSSSWAFSLNDGTTSNYIGLRRSGGAEFFVHINVSGTTTALIATGITSGKNKISIGYASNNIIVYVNGVNVGTDTSSGIPTTSDLQIGNLISNRSLEDSVSAFKLYNTRLTNTELQALTTL